jgi:pimeloyl-ACP methyl ester carboxylesterase
MTGSGPRRRLFLIAVLAAGVAVLMIPIVSRLLDRRPRFVYAAGAMTEEAYAALTADDYRPSALTVAPGIVLPGIVRTPTAKDAPWILFFPGNDATQLATAKKFLEHVRAGRDWGVAVWSYRGFSSAGGTPERDAMLQDAARIYANLLESEHLPSSRVHVVAFSLGGYFAAKVVGDATKAGNKPAFVSLLAAVENIGMVRASWAQRIAPGDIYEIQPFLGAVPDPVLVMIGTNDEALGVEQGRKIAAGLGPRARFIEVPGVAHNPLLEQDVVFRAVRKMVDPGGE